jgi:hypothetical protein
VCVVFDGKRDLEWRVSGRPIRTEQMKRKDGTSPVSVVVVPPPEMSFLLRAFLVHSQELVPKPVDLVGSVLVVVGEHVVQVRVHPSEQTVVVASLDVERVFPNGLVCVGAVVQL